MSSEGSRADRSPNGLGEQVDFSSQEYRNQFEKEIALAERQSRRPLRDYQTSAVVASLERLNFRRPQQVHLATGAGKTLVGNEVAVQWQKSHPGTVLWITKDWRLLMQSMLDLRREHHGYPVSRLGGDKQVLAPLDRGTCNGVSYTTIQTQLRNIINGRLHHLDINGNRTALDISLVIWDECHWGEHGEARKILAACKRQGIPVLGLTGTPRQNSRFEVAYTKTFWELVNEGFLATPIIVPEIETGVFWRPEMSRGRSDVAPQSLAELANHQDRNRVIAAHYAANSGKYGKTIMFACNIEHANTLAQLLLEQYGIPARSVHSDQSSEFVAKSLEDFRNGKVQVLVNVVMLTHGIDVPDARTVFLCRPTTSDILFSQMVGRAARLDEASGKKSFLIVEFTDNVLNHGELLQRAVASFSGSGRARVTAARSDNGRPRRTKHEYDPAGAPLWIPSSPNYPESCQGLWYREGQTFGIEFELTRSGRVLLPEMPEWLEIAEKLRSKLAAALPGRVADAVIRGYAGQGWRPKDCTVWNVESDSTAGWEVTSPVLANVDGFIEVDVACAALGEVASELGLKVNHRTGTHVHLGWASHSESELKRAIQLAKHFEPGLATVVAPSRIVHYYRGRYNLRRPNEFCAPVATIMSNAKLRQTKTIEEIVSLTEDDEGRYVTFNVARLLELGTVEVRMHSGTLEAGKILLWVSLWQQILWAARYRRDIGGVRHRRVIPPNGDIVALARKYLPDSGQTQQAALLRRLAARRAEVVEGHWRTSPQLWQRWGRFTRQWESVE